MNSALKKLILLLAFVLLAVACDAKTGGALPGHYEGMYTLAAPAGALLPVTAELSTDGKKSAELVVTSTDSPQAVWKYDFAWQGKGILIHTDHAAPGGGAGDFKDRLLHAQPDGCYANAIADGQTLRLCFADGRVSMTARIGGNKPDFSLDLGKLAPQAMPALEAPRSYSPSELMARAKSQSFSSLIEFQRVLEARAAAENARKNLLPHANSADLLNELSVNLLTMVKSVGDLAPFVLPSRWYKADELDRQSFAETEAWRIIRADAINMVEGLSYSVLQEKEAIDRLLSQHDSIARVRDQVRLQESIGSVQAGASEDITAILLSLERAMHDLREDESDQLILLARAAGFINPAAISCIRPSASEDSTVERPFPIGPDWQKLVLVRSAELRQVDFLLQAAKLAQKERYYQWMDPSGDTNGGLGAGLPAYLEIGKAQVARIVEQRKLLTSVLLGKLALSTSRLDKSVEDFALAAQSSDVQARRVMRNEQNLETGIGFVMSDLVKSLQDRVQAELEMIDARFDYYRARSELMRLIYVGPYADLGSAP